MFDRNFFVVAPNFHGATILSRLLNAHSDIVSLGDTYPSRIFDQICGCGKYVSQCPFWLDISSSISSERYSQEAALLPRYPPILGFGGDSLMYNELPAFLLKKLLKQEHLNLYSDDYQRFLQAVHRHHAYKQPHVFVDGVKSISRVQALKLAGVPISGVIHITRSPYDFVKSSEKQGQSAYKAAIGYRTYHRMASRMQGKIPYIRVSYEELATSTKQTLEQLFTFMDVPVTKLDELRENFGEAWHFMGNASLLKFDGTMRLSKYEIDESTKKKIIRLSGKQPPSVYSHSYKDIGSS